MNFSNILVAWYLSNQRDLPWRRTKDPYRIWLSEIILQQTRVAQGISYYLKFIEVFPTVFHLAAATEEEVLKLWQGLGYYSRARNLHFSAKMIVDNLKGVFPDNYQDLCCLKGVGDYTASAIASICYNQSTAVVDGNVYRVLARYFGIYTPINTSKGVKEFKKLAQEVMCVSDYGQYNQAIMDFGALLCKPQKPLCQTCPLQESCAAYGKKEIGLLPLKEQKGIVRKRYFNFMVFRMPDYQTVLLQRKGKGIWQNLYQFPLIETHHTIDAQTLIKHPDYIDLIDNQKAILRLYNSKEWVYKLTHQHLYVQFWIVKTVVQTKDLVRIDSLQNYPVPRLLDKFMELYDFERDC